MKRDEEEKEERGREKEKNLGVLLDTHMKMS